jgi:hypothetical protein
MAGYMPAGIDKNSRVIGLIESPISINIGGTTYSLMGYTGRTSINSDPFPVISAYTDTSVSSHELGHTFSACDEYSLQTWLSQQYPSPPNTPIDCPNEYPIGCGFDTRTSPGIEQKTNIGSPYCVNTAADSPNATYLNCLKAGYSKSTAATCGNGLCETSTETIRDCPQDCFSLDCPGDFSIGLNQISVMGSLFPYGTYSGYTKLYPTSIKNIIQSKLCPN